MSMQELFAPRGVVVAGSASEGKLGNILIKRLVENGFFNVCAVNPKAAGVGSVPGFVSAQEIDRPVDLAVIVSPAATVCSVLEDCGKAGIKAAIIITSGFAEVGRLDEELSVQKTAARYGIRYCGPNCAGMVNTHQNLFPTLEATPPKGSVALVSQSGSVGGMLMTMAAEGNLGISKFISYGNGYDLNELELLRYLKDDPQTSVIAMYLENIRDGRAFMRELKEVTKKKPVVIVKSGRTGTGQRATLSHTGSLAGSDAVYNSAFRECGAVRVGNIEEMFCLCKAFSLLGPILGKTLSIITNSGGPAVMSADCGEEAGLRINEPSEALKKQFAEFLPAHASLRNPIDLTVEGGGEQYRKATALALKESEAALAIYVGTPYLAAMPIAEGIIAAYQEGRKPVAATMLVGKDIKAAIARLEEQGIPCFPSGEAAVQALASMAWYCDYLQNPLPMATPASACGRLSKPLLSEAEAMQLLQKHNIPVLPFAQAKSAAEAVAFCQKIGYPVVMKVVSPDIVHKSGRGGVVLGISNDELARTAFASLQKAADGCAFEGVIIYPQLHRGHEIIVGLSYDAQFGPVIACGMGGIYTEIFRDLSIMVAPVVKQQAAEMIKSLRGYDILAGARGGIAINEDLLAEVIVKLSQLPFLYPDLREADLNPIFVTETELYPVDARIIGS